MAITSNSEHWKQVIENQISSGLAQTKWCEQNDVNLHNFRYWKNKLKNDESSKQTSEAPTWALVSSNSAEKERSMEPKSGEIDMQIGKFKITLRNSVDLNLLSDVISVLMRYA